MQPDTKVMYQVTVWDSTGTKKATSTKPLSFGPNYVDQVSGYPFADSLRKSDKFTTQGVIEITTANPPSHIWHSSGTLAQSLEIVHYGWGICHSYGCPSWSVITKRPSDPGPYGGPPFVPYGVNAGPNHMVIATVDDLACGSAVSDDQGQWFMRLESHCALNGSIVNIVSSSKSADVIFEAGGGVEVVLE